MAGKTISLVLGSGGARGLAHIGVIRWIDEHGLEIRSIAGSSMGALVGGIYAAGKLDIYERWVCALEKIDVLRLLDLSFPSTGLIKGDRVITILKDLIGNRNIEDLDLTFTAVATDIHAQKEVWINEGPLFDAIRASIAIPSLFTPHEYRGRQLFDGGLVNPIPIAPTLNDHNDLTIAVNLSARPDPEPRPPQRLALTGNGRYHQKIASFIDSLQQRLGAEAAQDLNILEVLSKSNETMQNTIARLKIAAYSPDATVDIPRNIGTFYEFYRAAEFIEIGYSHAAKALGHLLPAAH